MPILGKGKLLKQQWITYKNELRPYLSKYWKIPPQQNSEFVARMEDVLEVYQRPYDPDFPVVCMNESNKQLIGEVRTPIPMKSGEVLRIDDEYVRNGVAEIFLEVEPLAGRRHVKVTERRTKSDFAIFVSEMLKERYPNAKKVILVMDNLNTHSISSLYEVFPPEEAFRLAQRLEIHHTPKPGSWLNVAEIELSILKRQYLPERIPCIEEMQQKVMLWNIQRNAKQHKVDWQFTNDEARTKLKRLYPIL